MDDLVAIEVHVARLTRVRLAFRYTVTLAHSGDLVATGEQTFVFTLHHHKQAHLDTTQPGHLHPGDAWFRGRGRARRRPRIAMGRSQDVLNR